MTAVVLRPADPADTLAAVGVLIASRSAAESVGAIPPSIHRPDDVREWFAGHVMSEREVWVAESDGAAVAVMVLDQDWLDQLYVHPEATGQGVGSMLLETAKALRPGGLGLWCFASNLGAQRFYERAGFEVESRRSGSKERAPDICYRWKTSPAPTCQ